MQESWRRSFLPPRLQTAFVQYLDLVLHSIEPLAAKRQQGSAPLVARHVWSRGRIWPDTDAANQLLQFFQRQLVGSAGSLGRSVLGEALGMGSGRLARVKPGILGAASTELCLWDTFASAKSFSAGSDELAQTLLWVKPAAHQYTQGVRGNNPHRL